MSSFYGNIKNGTRVSLVFDKTYPNRYEMESAITQQLDTGKTTGNINGDGVYNTRYVLINYGERRYSPYISIPNLEPWEEIVDNKYTLNEEELPDLYVYTYNNKYLMQNNRGSLVYDINSVTREERSFGSYESLANNPNIIEDYDYYKKNNLIPVFYLAANSVVSNSNNILPPDLIDENCEYAINRETDEKYYQGSYDHTVWQKIWCSVKSNTTITEKYVMIAGLDAKAPKMNIIVDAPDDNNEYELVSKRYENGMRKPLPEVGAYYKRVGEDLGGYIYDELDTTVIEAWNNISDVVKTKQEELDTARTTLDEYKSECITKHDFAFNGDVLNEDYYRILYQDKDLQRKMLTEQGNTSMAKQVEVEMAEMTAAKVQHETNLKAYDDAVAALKEAADADYEALKEKEIYAGPFFDYRECISDITVYEDLVDEAGNQIIVSKEILDSYIEHLGNIYRKTYTSTEDDISNYELLDKGSPYKEAEENTNTVYHYYHKHSGDQGHITEELFDKLKVLANRLFYYDYDKHEIIKVDENTLYDKDVKYYERVASDSCRGPHFDPLRSTDLDYKMHTPRNWKFNTETDFQYNKAGFDPHKQSYNPKAKNEIYLKKEASGEVYPVHMNTEGYQTIHEGLSKEDADTMPQVPEAGFYVNNNLQYAVQIDQRKFDIDLSELGNMVSKLWDLVYPRGTFIKVENPNYNDENYKDGNYYYKKDDTYYQVGKGDILDPDETYYVFEDAPADSIDADRYMFIGNDRDPNADYPQTLAELIRYVYKLLGLETDNDYRDLPSQETIWGMFNGLTELLGRYDDGYGLERYIPVRSEFSEDVNDTKRERVFYGNAGDIYFGQIQTEDMYKTLHENALGPLYIIKDGFPIWNTVPKDVAFDPSTIYYVKDETTYTYSKADITEFAEGTTYYTAYCLFEKAYEYDINLQYYRDMNSLWALLREFQDARNKYQANWVENAPGSPSFIQHRPSVIYSKRNDIAEINYNDIPWIDKDEYREQVDINSQQGLIAKVEALEPLQWLTAYYLDENEVPQYELVNTESTYNKDADYYLIDKVKYDKKSYNIDDLWKSIYINPSDKQTYINNDDFVSITYLSYQDILDIFTTYVYLLPGISWFKAKEVKLNEIKSITFSLSDFPDANDVLESWDASRDSDGSITCYITKNQRLFIFADADKIFAHSDGTAFRLNDIPGGGSNVEYINNLTLLNTSNSTSMQDMFAECSKITSLDISKFDSSKVTNMNGMFMNCLALKNVDISVLDTSQVTDMANMFNGCQSMESIDASTFDTSQVTDMQYMFNHCNSLEELNLKGFDTSKVISMRGMFDGCEQLREIQGIDEFDYSNVTDVSYMFFNCENLYCPNSFTFELGGLVNNKTTNTRHMFNGCQSLGLSKTLPKFYTWDTSNVTNMEYMFARCGIPSTDLVLDLREWDTSNVTNMSNMFWACNFVNLNLSTFNTSKVTNFSNMFSDMKYLTKITIGPDFKWPSWDESSYLPDKLGTRWFDSKDSSKKYTPKQLAELTRTSSVYNTFERREYYGVDLPETEYHLTYTGETYSIQDFLPKPLNSLVIGYLVDSSSTLNEAGSYPVKLTLDTSKYEWFWEGHENEEYEASTTLIIDPVAEETA